MVSSCYPKVLLTEPLDTCRRLLKAGSNWCWIRCPVAVREFRFGTPEVFGREVKKAAHLGRKVMSIRVNGNDLAFGATVFLEHRNKSAGFDILGHQKARNHEQSLT